MRDFEPEAILIVKTPSDDGLQPELRPVSGVCCTLQAKVEIKRRQSYCETLEV
jgi:hypothetical protein